MNALRERDASAGVVAEAVKLKQQLAYVYYENEPGGDDSFSRLAVDQDRRP
jgi:hypothetical protein